MSVRTRLFCLLLSAPLIAGAQPQGSTQPASTAPTTARWNTPSAANPLVPGYFADPTLRRFGDTYYLYATTDGTGNGYGPPQVWVSRDFVNWQNIVMNWPTTEVVWAPDVVQQPDGRYRYYYCEPCNISVGESTSPIGPWHNLLGADDAVLVPDRYVHNAITLDPQLFRDDDGSEYLYFTTWGIYKGFGCGVAKLRQPTVQPPSGDARYWREDAPFPIAADTFFSERRLIPNTELKDIFEAPFVFKRGSTYYFTYSSGSCHDASYRVQYATSDTGPMGPFRYKGCILATNDDQTVHGPGHHSILEADGHYYIIYHRHNLPRSVHGFNRQVCIDELRFDESGDILPVTPSHDARGVALLAARAARRAPRNLTFGARVTASSSYDEWFRPEYAVDDNNATLWRARHTNWGRPGGHHDEWLQIDLGRAMRFTEVWTQFEYATFFYQYRIETSTDGTHWTLFADRTGNRTPGSPMIDRRKAKARYLRITITDTQKNGHLPAIWNVKVWSQAPQLPYPTPPQASSYPGMDRQDVTPAERSTRAADITLSAADVAAERTAPFDVSEVSGGAEDALLFRANKPLRARVKDGRWAFFFNGTQTLTSSTPLPAPYRYNSPYTIAVWVLPTRVGPVSTLVSLSTSRADLATTELRLGTDPATGLLHHNGSFESCGAPEATKACEGAWHHVLVSFDGWMERVWLDGELLHEQNNFLMLRPEGHITIGADGGATNHFMGYIADVRITPTATTAEEARARYEAERLAAVPSLGDDDFEEIDPDSKFTLPADWQLCYESRAPQTLSATNGDFNDSPLRHGGIACQKMEGDFVAMVTIDDMEGLAEHRITAYNEGGLLVAALPEDTPATDGVHRTDTTYYHLGAFPLYNCGNMLTVLSHRGRPQYPNYKGYAFDRLLQFERRGGQLFARTSADGVTWSNMPGSPIEVRARRLAVGIYQTTYTATPSWVRLRDLVIYRPQ